MRKINKFLVTGILLTASACTEPVEMNTTQMAAATGGVIGAGLGAIIGSQTGDPGAGLAIGAAAGVASGALIGDSIMRQEETLRNQDEAIERQERTIAAQRSELEELRKMNQDNPGFKTRLNNSIRSNGTLNSSASGQYSNRTVNLSQESRASFGRNPQASAAVNSPTSAGSKTVSLGSIKPVQQPVSRAAIRERNIQPQVQPLEPVAAKPQNSYSSEIFDSPKKAPAVADSIIEPVNEPVVAQPVRESVKAKLPVNENLVDSEIEDVEPTIDQPAVAAVNADISSGNSSECQQAAAEISKSKLASDTSDKLFHTRRAIRLCPQMPSYHHSLGDVYLSLNRKEDALFEFQEALKYDPTYAPAKESAAKLSSGKKLSDNKY